jgi:hypothetical protein
MTRSSRHSPGTPGTCFSGAPRPMKMGNIASPWRYDPQAYHTPEPENMRLPAIWCYASGAVAGSPVKGADLGAHGGSLRFHELRGVRSPRRDFKRLQVYHK